MKQNKKKKIAVIGLKGLPAFGGAATVGENIISQLKSEYDFTVYSTSSHTDKLNSKMDGFSQIVFQHIPLKKINTLYYYVLASFHALLFRKFDLVHLHHRDAAFLTIILRLKYQVIITTHGRSIVSKWESFKWYFRIQEKYFVKLANKVVCVSKNEVVYYNEKAGIDAIHIPNGMKISQGSMRFTKKDYLFFGAGRIVKSKGCIEMLKALKMINYEGEILIAGNIEDSGNHKFEVMSEAKGLNTDFLGLIKDKSTLLNYMECATLFLFPSKMEAMSMMLLEAVSVKVPVICSDIEENRDLFNDNEMLFFQTESVVDFSEKIKWALQNPQEMSTKAEAAFNKLSRDYTWELVSKQYSKLYNQMLTSV